MKSVSMCVSDKRNEVVEWGIMGKCSFDTAVTGMDRLTIACFQCGVSVIK